MGAAAEWTEPRGTLRSRPRAALSRPSGAPLPGLLPRNILKRLRRRRGGYSTRYLSRGARWTIACDAQKRGLLAHLGASAGPPCRLIYYHNNQEMGKSQSHISPHFAPVESILLCTYTRIGIKEIFSEKLFFLSLLSSLFSSEKEGITVNVGSLSLQ